MIARQSVVLAEGENRFTMRLPPLFGLVVRVPEEYRKGQLQGSQILGEESFHLHPTPLENGSYGFRHLPAGRYRLTVSGSEGGSMEVELPGPKEVDFRPDR
jgi:hypothetical protein